MATRVRKGDYQGCVRGTLAGLPDHRHIQTCSTDLVTILTVVREADGVLAPALPGNAAADRVESVCLLETHPLLH